MQHALWKPMSVGRIIDRGFQLYRSYFGKLMLVMLMTYGPFFLVSELMTGRKGQGGAGSLFQTIAKGGKAEDYFSQYLLHNSASLDGVYGILYLVLVLPIGAFVLFPVALAAVVGLVHRHVQAEEVPSAWELVKNALRRLGPMAGSTFLFVLMVLGIYAVAIGGIVGLTAAMFAGSAAPRFGGTGPGVGVAAVFGVLLFLFIVVAVGAIVWLMIRWGYYLPFVAMKEEGIGFRRSWRLTKRNFWRLFLLYFILTAILYMISFVLQMAVIGLIGMTVLGKLVQALVSMVVMPMYLLPYAVSFFDLRARNEGYGLEALIRRTIGEPGDNASVDEPKGASGAISYGGYGGQAFRAAKDEPGMTPPEAAGNDGADIGGADRYKERDPDDGDSER
ncbi:hypothetical protein SD70_08045 [Gordoniibacillus kamchatkensis]|uniref:Glycerophosphoryl diester phosphodiesterase membrane domain-containing protein n=1 Tax=Gordoniibacillus kamchatkensis TaxID=1590651 RepID=A0ABR5AJQ6_9BACL|nr:hypothetical protein [Paenibacillus sp. VKM B-2647]KIL41211.1 hypothetical protein SD70_08045 [Paenibacillus sp. VKM B-2647]